MSQHTCTQAPLAEAVAQNSRDPSMEQGLGSDETKQLTALSRFLVTDQEAAGRVRACKRPQEIVAVASELGFKISVEVLRKYARDLQARPLALVGRKRPVANVLSESGRKLTWPNVDSQWRGLIS
jgi:Nitrogen fixation protein of unknown function.